MVLEISVLLCFMAVLALALALGMKLVFALLAGLALFVTYALVRGHGVRGVFAMCGRGLYTARGILLLFVLLGLLTALWRAGGVIPLMVVHSVEWIEGGAFLLAVFLLNCGMSLLTGTALGTAATVGVVCATAGHALGVSPCWVGGAILSGAYFGNRLSPISSMALLTAGITKTDIYGNVRRMLKTTWLPLALSCGIYFLAGIGGIAQADGVAGLNGVAESVRALFAREFGLSPWCALPAVLMVILSVLRVRSSRVLLFSALAALPLALVAEGFSFGDVARMLVFGFLAETPELAPMINGGGLLSMMNVFWIVVVAGCYGGIFKETGMLVPLKGGIEKLSVRTNPFVAKLVTSCVVACTVCNQTLTIILTHQLTENLKGPGGGSREGALENSGTELRENSGVAELSGTKLLEDSGAKLLEKPGMGPRANSRDELLGADAEKHRRETHAQDLYDTAVTVIALVPWSVATAMVLAAAGAPANSVLCACFLYLLPFCRAIVSLREKRAD